MSAGKAVTFIKSLHTDEWKGQASLYQKKDGAYVVAVVCKGDNGLETRLITNVDESGDLPADPAIVARVPGMSHLSVLREMGIEEVR